MNAYLNQVIQQFQYARLGDWWQTPVDLSAHILTLEAPNEEIRYLHEEYETELHECVHCDRLYEAERDMDGWFESQYCEECYWDLNGEEQY